MINEWAGSIVDVIDYINRITYGILMYSERRVYVEVRGHGPLAPPEVHHAERRVALRGQRLRTRAPLARRTRRTHNETLYIIQHYTCEAPVRGSFAEPVAGGTDAGKVRA